MEVNRRFKPYPTYKDSGVEWLGEIPAGWEVKKLWHLTPSRRRIMYGIVLPGPNVADGVPIVKGGDVSPGRLRLDRLNRTTYEIESGYVRSRLRGGDLVYAIRGSIGEVGFVPEELEGANLTQDAARISYTAATHGPWLLHVLKSAAVFAQLEAGSLGATIRGVNIRDLKRASIPVPPRAEQERLAGFLDRETARIDALVAKKERLIELLQEKRTALITRAVTKGLDPNVPIKDSGVEWLGEIPAHWSAMPLGQAMQLVMDFRGRTPLKLGMNWGGDIPAISAVNVRDGHIDLLLGVNYGSSPLHDRWMTQGPTQVGDIVFTTEAPLGNVATVPDDRQYILSQRVVLLRPRPERLDATYLFHFLRSGAFRQGVESRATGSTAEGVKRRYLMSMPVCVPPLDEQRSVSAWLGNQVSSLERVLPATEQAIRFLQELRTALISAAVTGKIDVREEVAGGPSR
jgi:type I restriction enzyme S subunit